MIKKLINIIKKFSLIAKISLALIMLIFLVAIFASYLTTHPAQTASGPPLVSPNGEHLLGTDELGIDLWAQIAYGARVSLIVGFGTAFFSAFSGGILGIIAGYLGGWIDKILMRLIDIVIVLPSLPVMILLAAFFGPSLFNIILVLTLFSWVRPARIVRSQILMLKEESYIKSAKSYGASLWYLIKKHFLPEVFPLLAVAIIRLSGRAIVAEAGLSFLGLGDPTSRSWGVIIYHALNFEGIYYTPFWKWWLLYPWLVLTILIVSLAFIGRELEEIVDPRLRN